MPIAVCTAHIPAVEMRCAKNEFNVLEQASGEPWKVTSGDQWACPECDATVVIGFAPKGTERHEKRFADALKTVDAVVAER